MRGDLGWIAGQVRQGFGVMGTQVRNGTRLGREWDGDLNGDSGPSLEGLGAGPAVEGGPAD